MALVVAQLLSAIKSKILPIIFYFIIILLLFLRQMSAVRRREKVHLINIEERGGERGVIKPILTFFTKTLYIHWSKKTMMRNKWSVLFDFLSKGGREGQDTISVWNILKSKSPSHDKTRTWHTSRVRGKCKTELCRHNPRLNLTDSIKRATTT